MSIKIDIKSTKDRTILDLQSLGFTEILCVGKYSYSKPFRKLYPEVFEDFYEIIYVEKGEQEYLINHEKIILHSGELLIIRPHIIHSTGQFFENRGMVYWIIGSVFFHSFLGSHKKIGTQIIETLLDTPYKVICMSNKFEELLKQIFKIYKNLNKDSDIYKEKIKHNLFLLLSEIYEECKYHNTNYTQNYRDSRITKAVDYIRKNIHDDIDINYLAHRVAFMSFPHFTRVFKKTTSHTPRDFINLMKIDLAKQMLYKKKYVTTVSRNLGFSSTQYFATVFKKYTGMTPSEFQKK